MMKDFFDYITVMQKQQESAKEAKHPEYTATVPELSKKDEVKQPSLPRVETDPANKESSHLILGTFGDWVTTTLVAPALPKPAEPNVEELPVTEPVIEDNEIPSDDEILRQVGEDVLKQKLAASELTINRIVTYLQDINVPVTSTEPPEGQYFFHENVYYNMTSAEHIDAVYDIACDLKNTATLNHFLKKRPDVFTTWRTLIKKHTLFANTPHAIMNSIAPDTLVVLITKTLSSLYTERLAEALELSPQFKYNATAQALGKTILEYFISEAIKKLRIPVKDIKDESNPFAELYNIFSSAKYDGRKFTSIFKLQYKSPKNDVELAITSYFCRFLIRNDLITFPDAQKDRTILKLLFRDFADGYKPPTLQLGSFVLEALISIKLLEKATINEIHPNKTHVKIPVITITHETYIHCMASATFIKPTLAPEQKQP